MARSRTLGQYGRAIAPAAIETDHDRTEERHGERSPVLIAAREPRAALRPDQPAPAGADPLGRDRRPGADPADRALRASTSACRCCRRLAVVGCSVLLNLGLAAVPPRRRPRLGEREAALFLGYDTAAARGAAVPDRRAAEPVLDPDPGAGHGGGDDPVAAPGDRARGVRGRGDHACWRCGTCRCRGAPSRSVFPPELVLGIWVALVLATVFIGGYTWSVARGGAAAARRGGGDAAGAGARAAGLGGRRAGGGGGARARQPARDDRRRRQGAGARSARRLAACRGRGAAAEPVRALPPDPRRAGAPAGARTAARPIPGCRSRPWSRPPARSTTTRASG